MSCKRSKILIVMLGLFSVCWAVILNVPSVSYPTIQSAVTAANPGDTVQVAAGTYREQIYINKNITLSGADSTTTFIVPPVAVMNQPFLPGRQERPIVGVDSNGTNVVIEGFTIDGEGAANTHARMIGIQYYKASGIIRNNAVKQVRKTPFDGDQYTVGILVNHEFPREYMHAVEICNNSVYDFGKGGVVCNAPIAQGNIHHNVVIGQGPVGSGFAAQNGIQIGWGATGTIAYNNVSLISYTGPSWAASGIILVASGSNSIVDNNNLLNNQVAVYPSQYSSTYAAGTSNATISNNTVSASLSGTGTDFYGICTWSDGGAVESGVRSINKPSCYDNPYTDMLISGQPPMDNKATMVVAVTDNIFTATGTVASSCGMYLLAGETSPQTINATGNSLSGWEYGIITDKDPGASLAATVNYNDFSGNAYGMYNLTGVMQDAQCNWWGDASGPYHATSNPAGMGDTVSDNIDFSPWLGALPGTTPMTYYVNPGGSIQEVINMVAAGDYIYVSSGTYNETIIFATVDNLSIIGDPLDKPVINGGMKFQNTTPFSGLTLQNLYFKGDAGNNRIFEYQNTGAINNFSMYNCVLDGENVAVRDGIYGNKHAGTFTITNTEFKNILGYEVMDLDVATDVPYGRNELVLTNVTFANNSVHECNGSVALRGNNITKTANVYVYGNTITNIGGNQSTQGEQWAAIEVNHAVNVYVNDNSVSNVTMGIWDEGEAFQFWDVDYLSMYNNDIFNNYQGIYIFSSTDPDWGGPYAVPGGSIIYNNFIDNDQYGISVNPTATGGPLNAEYNWWSTSSGPYHAALNPIGLGDTVSDNVDFIPWVTMIPALVSPINNDTTNVLMPTFNWEYNIYYPDSFNFVVGTETKVNSIDTVVPGWQTQFTPLENLDPGTYLWKVRSKDGFNNWSDFSEERVLTIVPYPTGWSLTASMPTNNTPKLVKDGGAIVATDDAIYGFKGWKSNAFYKFDGTDWTVMESIPFGYKPTDPSKINKKRPGKGASLCWDGMNTIYATKGNNTKEFWAYDIALDTWIAKAYVTVPKALKGGTSIAYSNAYGWVFLLAGGQKVTDPTNFYFYNPGANTWTTLEKAPLSPNNKKWADGSALVTSNIFVYALKGKDKQNYLYRYYYGSTWEQLESIPLIHSVLSKKNKVGDGGAMTTDGSFLYAIKGNGKRDFWKYNLATYVWSEMPVIPLKDDNPKSVPKTGAGLAYMEGCVYLLKGNKLNEFWRYNLLSEGIMQSNCSSVVGSVMAERSATTDNIMLNISFDKYTKRVNYSVPKAGRVILKLYNTAGRLIEIVYDGYLNAGNYSATVNLRRGVYFLKYDDGANRSEVKLIVQ